MALENVDIVIVNDNNEYDIVIVEEGFVIKNNIVNNVTQTQVISGIGEINWTSANYAFI